MSTSTISSGLTLGPRQGAHGEFRDLLTPDGTRVGSLFQNCGCGGADHANHRFRFWLDTVGRSAPYRSEAAALRAATALWSA